ncbi:MAG: alkaline phosphatase family protein [Anaerolineae bacterium]|nr:alkaline phosphatase family protein [Anaerolineae bacterium]
MLELRLFIMLRRYFGLVLILALTLAGAVAETLRDDLWQRYRRYASPYLAPAAAGAPASPLASRVVVVVVRDLRLDVSRSMPTLNALRDQGAEVVLALPGPTYRAPAWMTLLSGATPEIHGFTTNDTIGKIAPDTVLRRALAARRNTVVIGGQIWEDVLNNDIQRFDLAPAPASGDIDAETARAAVEVLNDRLTSAQLVIVELEGMTNRSDARSVERVDAALRIIADAVSLPGPRATAALLVVADRGVLSDGSDGGDEEAIARTPWLWPVSASGPGRVSARQPRPSRPRLRPWPGLACPPRPRARSCRRRCNPPRWRRPQLNLLRFTRPGARSSAARALPPSYFAARNL